jgi:adenylate cyclase
VALGLMLASRIARPLADIAGEMEQVGQFRVEDRPPRPTVFTEIAMMDGALARMKKGLRSFSSYVPRDLVRSLIASGQEAVLAGEVKQLTIFFSDIAGFTTIAETMSPDALVKLLGGYFEETTRIIAAKHGTVDKFIGDGIMAFWGAPEDNSEHAALACEASVLYQRRIDELKAAGEPWAQHLQARIGLATGEVLVGNIGSPARLNYTVMGDTVNLSARLEGLNKAYGTRILVAEATYEAARSRVIGRAVDVAAVKGKARGVRLYELLCLVTDEDPQARALSELCERALDAYLRRDFTAAIATWREVLALIPGDGVAEVMIERAEQFLAQPPPKDWSGVHVVHEK